MSKPVERVGIITGHERRRRTSAEEKVWLVEETARPGMTVSATARLHGTSPSLLFGWRRRMAEGSFEAVRSGEDVVPASRPREVEAKVRELERLLGRKTMEAEILREALDHARKRTAVALALAARGRFPVKAVTETLGVVRSNLVEQLRHPERRRRGPCRRQGDEELLAEIRAITDVRPTCGCRRVTALLNRARHGSGNSPVNGKRVLRVMRQASLTLQPCDLSADRARARARSPPPRPTGAGLLTASPSAAGPATRFTSLLPSMPTTARSSPGWPPQAATAGQGISGELVRDMMLDCVDAASEPSGLPTPCSGWPATARPAPRAQPIDFATALNLVACFTPVRSPESNGVRESFMKTLKRDYVRVNPCPDP